jgi:hypothetical protein
LVTFAKERRKANQEILSSAALPVGEVGELGLERISWGLVGVGTKASRREAYEGLDGFAKSPLFPKGDERPSRGRFSLRSWGSMAAPGHRGGENLVATQTKRFSPNPTPLRASRPLLSAPLFEQGESFAPAPRRPLFERPLFQRLRGPLVACCSLPVLFLLVEKNGTGSEQQANSNQRQRGLVGLFQSPFVAGTESEQSPLFSKSSRGTRGASNNRGVGERISPRDSLQQAKKGKKGLLVPLLRRSGGVTQSPYSPPQRGSMALQRALSKRGHRGGELRSLSVPAREAPRRPGL